MNYKEGISFHGKTQGFYEGSPQALRELRDLGKGKLVVLLTGPNGVGKGTIEQSLQEDHSLGLRKPVLYTSRPIGIGEQPGVDYNFTSTMAFENMIGRNAFLQWSRLGEKYYGTAMEDCKDIFATGKNIILEPGKTSTLNLKKFLSNADIPCIDICVSPVDPQTLQSEKGLGNAIDILRERMRERQRGEESAVIESRLVFARTWLQEVDNYSHVVTNAQNDVAGTITHVKQIILTAMQDN